MLLSTIFFIVGCDQFQIIEDLPVKVYLSSAVTDVAHQQSFDGAIDFWNTEFPGIISASGIVAEEDVSQECGTILVVNHGTERGKGGNAHSWDGCTAVITFKPTQSEEYIQWVIAHELGHLFLGAGHEGEENILYFGKGGRYGLTDEQRDFIQHRM